MYPQCRHIHPNGGTCQSPALAKGHWCYYHTTLNRKQAAHRARLQAGRHEHRLPDGRFAAPDTTQTLDYGAYPVGAPHTVSAAPDHPALDLPPLEDAASIQLALIDVLQALAANRLDPKRAGLLLYGLQVASANAKNFKLPTRDTVRDHTETPEGTPLAPQEYGRDWEDYGEEDDEEDEDEEEEDE